MTSTLTTLARPAHGFERRHGRRAAVPAGPRHATVHGPNLRRTRRVAIGSGVLALTLGGGTALAFVHAAGSGSGTARITGPGLFTAVADVGAGLSPYGEVSIQVTVSNPYQRPLVVQGLAAAGPAVLVGTGHTGCDPASVTFSATVNPAAPSSTIAPGSQAAFPGAVAMAATAAPQCQGATFRTPVLVTARLS